MKNKLMLNRKILIFAISLICFTALNIYAQVPANLQAALFKKIFTLDKTLAAKGTTEVAVLTGSGNGDEIVSAFSSVGISAKAVSGNQPPAGANVVYVMEGVEAPSKECASGGILSISGDPSFVEDGKVAIGIGTEGGKPKIIVNFAQLKAEGQEVSASLLNIAKVIK